MAFRLEFYDGSDGVDGTEGDVLAIARRHWPNLFGRAYFCEDSLREELFIWETIEAKEEWREPVGIVTREDSDPFFDAKKWR